MVEEGEGVEVWLGWERGRWRARVKGGMGAGWRRDVSLLYRLQVKLSSL